MPNLIHMRTRTNTKLISAFGMSKSSKKRTGHAIIVMLIRMD